MTDQPQANPTPQELGFGSQIATRHGDRLISRDGTFPIRRVGHGWRARLSLYHSVITKSWPAFLGWAALAYLAIHTAFAFAYLLGGSAALSGPGSGFTRAFFFFSVHTFSGIGYGHITPVSQAANWIATAEAWTGMIGLALVASHTAIVAPFQQGLGLMLRVANQRKNQIVSVHAQVLLSCVEQRADKTTRTYQRLKLENDAISLFPMSWTIVHPIDDASPLAGHDRASLEAVDAEILVMLSDTDETFAQTVHWRTSYKAHELEFGVKFADIYERAPNGVPIGVNLGHIHCTEPV